MRTALLVIGLLAALIGLLWIGQGTGLVKGSVMTGRPLWAWIGAATLIVGAGLAAFSRRPARPR